MRHHLPILYAALLLSATAGCGAEHETRSDATPPAQPVATPVADPTPGIHGEDEKAEETTVIHGADTFRVFLRQYVSPDSTHVWQPLGSGADADTARYYDNELSVRVERNGEVFISRILQKEDFASVAGEDFVPLATLNFPHLEGLLPHGEGVRFFVNIGVPDTDSYGIVRVDLKRDTMELEMDWPDMDSLYAE